MGVKIEAESAAANTPSALKRAAVKALRAVPQYTRMSRHLWSLIKHSTPRKVFNLARVELEYRLRRTTVRGRPYILIIDPTNVCNLRCPLCPTGTGDLGRHGQMISWETFTKAFDQLAPYAYEVNLHNWGESLLHPRIGDLIEYASKRNVATNMSANLNSVSDELIDRLITSGLEYLILSIDGASQETYARYRVRGNFDDVMVNARKLMERKRALGSRTPHVEWQFIVFKHNAHEVDAARAMAEDLGVDTFRLVPPGLPFDSPEQDQLKRDWFVPKLGDTSGEIEEFRGQNTTPCFYLYRSFTTNPDGKVAPCCVVYGENNDFGDIVREGFDTIWNNAKYRSARAQFRKHGDVTVPTVCDRCDWFEKRTQPPWGSPDGTE